MNENAVVLAKVARGWRYDSAFADYNFAPLPHGLPNVVFAYEVGRFFHGGLRIVRGSV